MEVIQPILDWFSVEENQKLTTAIPTVGGTIVAVAALLWAIITFVWNRNGRNQKLVDQAVAALTKQLEAKDRQIETLLARDGSPETELRAAIEAVPRQTGLPNAKARIEEALRAAADGNPRLAEAIFREVEEREAAKGRVANRAAAEAARHRGALAFLHDTQAALDAYRRATKLDPDNMEGWNQLGALLLRLGDLSGTEDAFRRVEALAEAVGDPSGIAAATGNLGLVYRTRGDLDRAEAMFEQALAINEELGRKKGMASNYGNLGLVHRTRGHLDQAEEMFQKALAIEKELGHREGMAIDYGNLSVVYRMRGDLDCAEAILKKSLAIEEALGRKEGIAIDYGNLGIVYGTRGDIDRAVEMFEKALAIDEELGRKEGMANQYGNLGVVYKARGQLDYAEAMHGNSLTLNEELGRKEGMATQLLGVGLIYQTRGDLDRAEEMFEKALALFEQVGAKPRVEQTRRNLESLRARRSGRAGEE